MRASQRPAVSSVGVGLEAALDVTQNRLEPCDVREQRAVHRVIVGVHDLALELLQATLELTV